MLQKPALVPWLGWNKINDHTVWYKVCKDCRLKLARWIFLSHFWPLQNGVVFFEALGTITKIFSSSKPSHRIKLRCSKLSVGQTEDFDIETQCWDLHCILESISSTFYSHILRQFFGAKNYKAVFWVWIFLGAKILTKKAHIKCWWNLHQVGHVWISSKKHTLRVIDFSILLPHFRHYHTMFSIFHRTVSNPFQPSEILLFCNYQPFHFLFTNFTFFMLPWVAFSHERQLLGNCQNGAHKMLVLLTP